MEMRFPIILDGATGTQLQKRGFTGDMSAEQWVLESMSLESEEEAEHRACHDEVRQGEIAEQPAVGIAAVIGVPDIPGGREHGGQQKDERCEPERPPAVLALS